MMCQVPNTQPILYVIEAAMPENVTNSSLVTNLMQMIEQTQILLLEEGLE